MHYCMKKSIKMQTREASKVFLQMLESMIFSNSFEWSCPKDHTCTLYLFSHGNRKSFLFRYFSCTTNVYIFFVFDKSKR